MDFLKSIAIAASGLRAQAGRMRVLSENIANADSTATRAGGDPYRRKIPTFRSEVDRALDAKVVTLGRVRPDQGEFRNKYEPGQRDRRDPPHAPAHDRHPARLTRVKLRAWRA